jgi:hypothetical protein
MVRSALVLAVVVAIAGAARAQAPGEIQPQPQPPPVPAAPQPPPQPTVMERRWAIAAGLGSETLHVDGDGAPRVPFAVLELALRLRVVPTFEVALAFTAGGATKGDLTTSGLYLEGRYRFLAGRPWNIFLLASLGVASVAPEDGNDVEKRGRGSLRLGGGIERRFGAFAIEASLRAVGIGKNEDVPLMTPATNDNAMTALGVSGGTLSIGALYYF